MSPEKINTWLSLLANFGVLIGIIFLAIEIQQNNNLLERDITLSQQDAVNGQFINSDYLPGIQKKIYEAEGIDGYDRRYIEEFNLTEEESIRWARYINQIWRQNEANWEALGGSDNICRSMAGNLNRRRDYQIYWENRKQAYIPRFVECIEAAR